MKCRLPTLQKCCCFSVQTGAIIFGIIDVLICLTSLILTSILLSNYDPDYIKNIFKQYNAEQDINSGLRFDDNTINLICLSIKYTLIMCIIVCFIVAFIITFLFVGIIKKKHLFLIPYLGLKILEAFQSSMGVLFSLFAIIGGIDIELGIFILLYTLGWTCLFVYMWIVVYSHYVVLKEENARGQYDKQAYRAT